MVDKVVWSVQNPPGNRELRRAAKSKAKGKMRRGLYGRNLSTKVEIDVSSPKNEKR